MAPMRFTRIKFESDFRELEKNAAAAAPREEFAAAKTVRAS